MAYLIKTICTYLTNNFFYISWYITKLANRLVEQFTPELGTPVLTKEMSSSGWMSLDVKPELDSGFLIWGAPVIVAPLCTGELLERAAAAAGNVGFTGADVGADLKLAVGGADMVADEDWNTKNISLKNEILNLFQDTIKSGLKKTLMNEW